MAKIKKKFNFKSMKTWKKVLIIGLACITLVGAVAGISALFRKSEETTKQITPSYAIGGLTADGRYKETTESIYTKDAFECQGLSVAPIFESTISYRIYFYDSVGNFVDSTETLKDKYNDELSFGVTHCRIVIIPNDDTDIKWYEVSKYSKQLNITVGKAQKEVASAPVNILTSANLNDAIGNGKYYGQDFQTFNNSPTFVNYGFIDCADYDQLRVVVDCGTLAGDHTLIIHFGRGEDTYVSQDKISLVSGNTYDNAEFFISIPSNAEFLNFGTYSDLGLGVKAYLVKL